MYTIKNVMQHKVLLILILVVLLTSVPVQTAAAALRTCRTDPIVFLNNGMNVSLTTTIATDPSNVNTIVYELHVPKGAAVTNVVFTGGEFAKKEVVAVWADQPQDMYKSDTIVFTHTGLVDVSASTMLLVGVGSTAHGRSGEHLKIELRDPGTESRKHIAPPVR